MPRKNQIPQRERKVRPPRVKRPRPPREPRQKRAISPRKGRVHPSNGGASSSDKLRTTRVSNEPRSTVHSGNSVKDSQKAAVGVLDPFAAFAHGYKTGLPFAAATVPAFGLWTRYVKRMVEVPFGTTVQAGARATINPWGNNSFMECTQLDSAGLPIPVGNVTSSDPQLPFFLINFENMVVAYQGLRVRNLTPVLSQGGESVIGNASYIDATTSNFDQLRSSANSMIHANGDPGVICQATYFGNPANELRGAGFVTDYQFAPASYSSIDPETRCITFASFGEASAPQIFEFEVITYYLAVPFAVPSQIFQSVRYDVEPAMVNRLLDQAYNKAPMYSVPRNFVKDDGWDTMWTGAKAIITDIGLGLLGTLASAVGSAFSGLFAKDKFSAFYRVLSMLPPEHYSAFRDVLNAHATLGEALVLVSKPPPIVLTRSEMVRLAAFLAASEQPEAPVLIDAPATAAGGAPRATWFGRK